ncbi:MAG: hypothetical protein GX361_04255 [Bacteroidales bacterium]|nr:hypothetical protein [Bacteroidales bacterium]
MKLYNKKRLKALIIDLVFIAIVWCVLFALHILIFKNGTKYDTNVGLALFLSLFLCKDNINGQSIGKRLYKLRVVDNYYEELNTSILIGRNLFVFFAPIELILLIYYDKRIGDKMLKTKVVLIEKTDKITFKNVLIYLLSFFIVALLCLPLGGI